MSYYISRFFGGLFLIILISLCYIIARSVVFYNRDDEKNSRQFWARESEANSVRRKDISALDYIQIPIDTLPMQALIDAGLASIHECITKLASERILNLSEYTNTDLKIMYGPANLDELSQCDERFTNLIRTLQSAATALLKIPGTDMYDIQNEAAMSDATAFLEYAVSIGSDMSNSYELLGIIYTRQKNTKAFKELYHKADRLSSMSKDMILNKLHNIKTA